MIGLYSSEMINFLKSEFNIQGELIKFLSLEELLKHCILFICSLSGDLSSTHAVVFDAETQCILEPNDELLDLKNYNIICCIRIQ